MAIPIASFTLEDFLLLGPPVSHLIITTLAAIHSHRLLVAYNLLQPCQCNWEAAWWDGLARHYLHPDFPLSPQDMLLKLEKSSVQGVTTACQLEVLRVIKEQRVFEVEDDLKEEALKKIRAYEGTIFRSQCVI